MADPHRFLENIAKARERVQKPGTLHDDFFGELVLEQAHNWFEGNKEWQGRPVRLRLSMDEGNDTEALLRMARALWIDQEHWHMRIAEFAVEKLLPKKNGAWLDDDEEELTPDDFISRMELTTITLHSDGRFDFWHNDGDLFCGHAIQISGSIEQGPARADIPG